MKDPVGSTESQHRGAGPGLALVSAGVTAWQVTLMQVLGSIGWYHFAYLVIALALLGFGASGTVLALARAQMLPACERVVFAAAAFASAGMALAPDLVSAGAVAPDLYLLFADWVQAARLAVACIALAIPFFLCGLAIGLMLTSGAAHAGRLYAWNLAGSGVGGVSGWLALGVLTPSEAPAVMALLPLVGSIFLWPAKGAGKFAPSGLLLLVAIAVAATMLFPARLKPSQFKDISRLLDLPDARVVLDDPDSHGWLQIVETPVFRPAPPASLRFDGAFPVQRVVLLDGNLRGSLLVGSAGRAPAHLDFSLEAVAWAIGRRSKVMLLESGGEGLAVWAKEKGAGKVVCVEPHPGIARELEGLLPAGVTVENREPRNALATAGADWDLIRYPIAGTFGGSAGMRAVGEQFLFTTGSFSNAFARLSADGVIVTSAWTEQPERNASRLLATILQGLRLAGVGEPGAHVAAVRSWNATAFIVKRTELDEKDNAAIESFCRRLEFDPLVLRGELVAKGERIHEAPGSAFTEQIRAVLDGDIKAAESAIGGVFRLGAATDDRPYFSQFLRITRLRGLTDPGGWRSAPFIEMGYLLVAASVPVLLAAALVLVVAPLSRVGWSGGARWATALFSTGLGLGFMFVEIGLIARLTLFLGGALSSAATVITTLLVAAGAGSAMSQRLRPSARLLARISIGVAAVAGLLGALTAMTPAEYDAPLAVRMLLAGVLVAPAGMAMGMAFPTLLRFLETMEPSHVPWAWAVNGCASVLAPSLATILAVLAGHWMVFIGAAAAYLLAAASTTGFRRAGAS